MANYGIFLGNIDTLTTHGIKVCETNSNEVIEDSPYFMSLIGPIKGVPHMIIAVVLLSCSVRLFR